MVGRRQYPPETRQAALELAAGHQSAYAAEQLGIPVRSIQRWVESAEPAEMAALVARKRAQGAAQVADRLLEGLEKAQNALEDATDLSSAKTARELSTAWAILVDKMHQLSGSNVTGVRFGGDDASSSWTPELQAGYERVRVRDFEVTRRITPAQPPLEQPSSELEG